MFWKCLGGVLGSSGNCVGRFLGGVLVGEMFWEVFWGCFETFVEDLVVFGVFLLLGPTVLAQQP